MIVQGLLVNAAILVVLMLALWRISIAIDDVSFIDAVWGGAMALLAVTSYIQLFFTEGGPSGLATVILAMTAAWGVRLFGHLFQRWRREGEDPRYQRILSKDRDNGTFARAALVKVFGMQAVLLFLVSSPAQVGILAAEHPQELDLVAWAGVALFLVGVAFEWIGDYQLERFRADPANKGNVLDTGLWRYTRHPNYFGDACAWWGIWLAAASQGWEVALWTIAGPIFLTFTLTRWSGVTLLEKGMSKSRGDKYGEYKRRTSAFVPLPPKSGS